GPAPTGGYPSTRPSSITPATDTGLALRAGGSLPPAADQDAPVAGRVPGGDNPLGAPERCPGRPAPRQTGRCRLSQLGVEVPDVVGVHLGPKQTGRCRLSQPP